MKPVRFWIKTSFGRRFFCVIFSNRKMMMTWANKHNLPQPNGTEAFAHTHQVWSLRKKTARWFKSGLQGYICFHQKKFGAGMVAHEMVHAASFALAEKWKWKHIATTTEPKKDKKRTQEALALEVGYLCAQFWDKWYRLTAKQASHPDQK